MLPGAFTANAGRMTDSAREEARKTSVFRAIPMAVCEFLGGVPVPVPRPGTPSELICPGMLRGSRFTGTEERKESVIYRYKNNGYNLVLDVNSGSVHVVDELCYDVLGLMDEGKSVPEIQKELENRYPAADVAEVCGECEELRQEGMLFTEDVYRNAIDLFQDRPTVVKARCRTIATPSMVAGGFCLR